jgi:hypothetical protein
MNILCKNFNLLFSCYNNLLEKLARKTIQGYNICGFYKLKYSRQFE